MVIHGMRLMHDTASLTNALMANTTNAPKVGDTFAELMWTDRTLWVITEVVSPKEFKAQRVETELKCWEDGTEFPKRDADGKFLTDGSTSTFKKPRKYWYCDGRRVSLSFGATTGYRDPSF